MEFHLAIGASAPDLVRIEDAVHAVDPAALVDVDGATVRVSTSLDASGLQAALGIAGYPVAPAQLTQLPSICCGGCSG